MTDRGQTNSLHGLAQFALFVTSYLPLFFLIAVRQVSENCDYLNWVGFSLIGIKIFFLKFGLTLVLTTCSITGWIGYKITIGNIERVAQNGFPITVTDVKNKNSEAIGYIATYIIPFLFQSFNGWYECFSVLMLMYIIYRIYINSSLLLINPLLSINFAIYEIEYRENLKTKNGLIISKNKYLQEDTEIKLYEIGHKLYFATDNT